MAGAFSCFVFFFFCPLFSRRASETNCEKPTHLFPGEAVLFPQHRVQRPEPKLPDPPQLARAREEVLASLPGRPHPLGHAAAELADEREVVVVALVVFPRARVEEQVARGELEDEAGEGPHVGGRGVLGAEEDLEKDFGSSFFCFFKLFRVSLIFRVLFFPNEKEKTENDLCDPG